jgi:hypothetical protein
VHIQCSTVPAVTQETARGSWVSVRLASATVSEKYTVSGKLVITELMHVTFDFIFYFVPCFRGALWEC